MIYRVRHRTTYDYKDPVSVSHHLVRLTPRNLPGQIDKGVGKSFRIWGIQEQTFGQLHEGWIGKQVLNAGDLAEAADTVQHNIVLQFDGILESPADVNAWLRSQGVPAFDSVPDNWPL